MRESVTPPGSYVAAKAAHCLLLLLPHWSLFPIPPSWFHFSPTSRQVLSGKIEFAPYSAVAECVRPSAPKSCPNWVPSVMVFAGGDFEKGLGQEGGAFGNGISANKAPESSLALAAVGEHSRKTAVCDSGSGSSPDMESPGTSVLDFPASRTLRNTFLVFINHPAYGIPF